jgi:hypothetical protein
MARSCDRPACDRIAVATMAYDYGRRAVWIDHLSGEPHPSSYDLCVPCSDRMTAPRSWILTDVRERELFDAVG